jgi:hypothetical protein
MLSLLRSRILFSIAMTALPKAVSDEMRAAHSVNPQRTSDQCGRHARAKTVSGEVKVAAVSYAHDGSLVGFHIQGALRPADSSRT